MCGQCGDDALAYYNVEGGADDHFQCCSVPQQRTVAAQLQELTATQETMYKVYDALKEAGLTRQQALDAINEMQNAGIYFREAKDD